MDTPPLPDMAPEIVRTLPAVGITAVVCANTRGAVIWWLPAWTLINGEIPLALSVTVCPPATVYALALLKSSRASVTGTSTVTCRGAVITAPNAALAFMSLGTPFVQFPVFDQLPEAFCAHDDWAIC